MIIACLIGLVLGAAGLLVVVAGPLAGGNQARWEQLNAEHLTHEKDSERAAESDRLAA